MYLGRQHKAQDIRRGPRPNGLFFSAYFACGFMQTVASAPPHAIKLSSSYELHKALHLSLRFDPVTSWFFDTCSSCTT